jgi:opacity protein-like surface antigen
LLKRYATAFYLVLGASALWGQARPTASRTGDFQIGVDYVGGSSDYGYADLKGVGLYTTFDFTSHFGAEFDLHQANTSIDKVYERTYEIGGRYHRNYGRAEPYAKVMIGRGVFNFALDGVTYANLAYNMFAVGGGVDYHLTRYLNVRGDYEYQDWGGFPPNGLTPQLISIGVAYHFPAGLKRGRHY